MAVTVVLLAAGYATRLYPLTLNKPKPLLPLGQGVILDAVVKSLKQLPGLSRTVLVTNHRCAEEFHRWQQLSGLDIRVLDDGTSPPETRLGGIRDLELAKKEAAPGDDLLVVGTDNLFHWPLGDFVSQAQAHGPSPSVALWQAPSAASAVQFGVVIRDAENRVVKFVEKSPTPPSMEVALCLYYFPSAMHGKIREFIESGENTDAPGYFIAWLSRKGTVYGIMMPGQWHDIGTQAEYETVVKHWRS